MRSSWSQNIQRKAGGSPATSGSSPPSTNPSRPSLRSETSAKSLQERLWNQAYDEVKINESKLVEAYEKLLSAELQQADSTRTTPNENKIKPASEGRWHQMKQLVQSGLQRTEKGATVKENIGNGIRIAFFVKPLVDEAVRAAPEAALAWVGICLALEVSSASTPLRAFIDTQQILSNPFTEPRINREGIAYVVSRMNWYWSLVGVLLDEETAGPAFSGLRDQLENHIIQLYQKLLLYQMKSICLYHRKRIAVFFGDVIKLDDWRGQLNDIKEAEDAVRTDSYQFNSQQVQYHLQDLATTAERQRQELQTIYAAIICQTRQQEKMQRDERDEECLTDLRVTDPRTERTRIETTKGGLLRDSYRWILNHADFRQWRDDPHSPLLWIRGDPGKGKTMLLCGIINELQNDTSNQLSYFFCEATDAVLSTATAILRGLIYLLVSQQPLLVSYIRKKYDHAHKQLFEDRNAWFALSEIFTAMIEDPDMKHTIFIVDALDECRMNRPALLDLIIRVSSSPRTKWIVSSRNWLDIEEKLDNTTQKITLRLELNEGSISDAVGAYIKEKVGELERLKKYNTEIRNAVQQHFTNNADNTFLWVSLAYRHLAGPKVRKWHTLSILETFPPGLDSLYERMMEQICDSHDADLCKQILAVASVVYRPIALKELVSIVELLGRFDDFLSLEEIITACGDFLTLRDGIVYFIHQSAKDFLLNMASGQILPFGIAYQHRAIFSRSLDVLSSTLRRDIYELGAPGLSITNISPPDPDPLGPIRYSCIHWVDHLHDSNPAETITHETLQDEGSVHHFLKHKYLYWLEAISLLRGASQAILAIHKLVTLVRGVGTQQLSELVRDAYRFALSHKEVIETAPLQLYVSALIFSPTSSLIRKYFDEEAPSWILSKPAVETNWNACLQTLEGHSDEVTSLAFSHNGQWLASGSKDSTVKLWDATTGVCVQTLENFGWVRSVTFSADSQQLASGSYDGTIKVWDAVRGACLALRGHNGTVTSVAFSPDGQFLASGSLDLTVRIWGIAIGVCVNEFTGHSGGVCSVAFSADGQRLASASGDYTVRVWDPTTGKCLRTLEGHGGTVASVAFSTDGKWLASGSSDHTVMVWDATVATGACVQTLEGHRNRVFSVAFSADGQRLASGSDDRTVKIWDIATGKCVQTLDGHGNGVSSVAFSADGKRLASGSSDHTVMVWDATVATGTCVRTLDSHSDGVESLAFSADGYRLASGSFDHTVKVWDTATGKCLQTFEGHTRPVNSVIFSADGRRLASGSYDRTVKVWDIVNGECVGTLEGYGVLSSVAFSADGKQILVGCWDETVKVWDAVTGNFTQTLKGHDNSIASVAFSADGHRLASGSFDHTVKVWDTATGKCLHTLNGHTRPVTSVAFSADGQWLASGCWDETVRVWHVPKAKCVQTIKVSGPVSRLAFSAKSNTHLSTDLGILTLDPSAKVTEGPYCHGYRISSDSVWIVKDSKRLLWLPSQYRTRASAITGSNVALGCASGRVLAIQFSMNEWCT